MKKKHIPFTLLNTIIVATILTIILGYQQVTLPGWLTFLMGIMLYCTVQVFSGWIAFLLPKKDGTFVQIIVSNSPKYLEKEMKINATASKKSAAEATNEQDREKYDDYATAFSDFSKTLTELKEKHG